MMQIEEKVEGVNSIFKRYESNWPRLLNDACAFGGSVLRKEEAVNLARAHQQADLIIQGQYWVPNESYGYEQIGGCAVGCLSHQLDDGHAEFPRLYGIPEDIAHAADDMFEALDDSDARAFPVQFMEAVPVGADLSGVLVKMRDDSIREYLEAHPDTAPDVKALLEACIGVAGWAARRILVGEYGGLNNDDVWHLCLWGVEDMYNWRGESVIESRDRFLQALRSAPIWVGKTG